ncbi:MAG TPA: HAMP domain-containing sensor histidine kinase [Candidatus Angelobacter sp.]
MRWKERLQWYVVVLALTAVLIVLAAMQYRWSKEVSQAASERMELDLESTMMRWRDDLYREIAGFCLRLQMDPQAQARERRRQYAQQYDSWTRTAPHPNVIANVFVLENEGAGLPHLLRLDPATGEFKPAAWPPGLEALHDRLLSISAELAVAASHLKSPEELRDQAGGHGPSFPLLVDQDAFALAQPILHRPPRIGAHTQPALIDWVVVGLNRPVLTGHILPELVQRHFGNSRQSSYQVAVVTGAKHQPIYSSDSGFPSQGGATPDETIRVFGPPLGPTLRSGDLILFPAYHRIAHDGRMEAAESREALWPIRIEPLHYSADDDEWYIIARHRKGSLEAAVNGMRQRNLAVSCSVVLLLGASMLVLLINSRRAQSLARMQMDFVAAVSHELRTPLAVITSAADNIADGVVEGRQQMQQYGGAIKSSARQLIHLVEQVLTFAASRNQHYRFNLAPLTVQEIVDKALENTAETIQAAGFSVERRVAPGLPGVMGDRAALVTCLQNLITNAVKYGGEARWMAVRAELAPVSGSDSEVQITVADCGIGISERDARHIFEPFFRSTQVAEAQIRGSGLGLALARRIAEAMGGKLTVRSKLGEGSAFTLHLPAIAHSLAENETVAATPAQV